MIEKYSSSSTNAYIHELTGDILMKKDSISLAKEQYQIAKEKYIDEASLSIISMKLANIDS
jgi:predicted negative regulator of RcsB-dependent stress response